MAGRSSRLLLLRLRGLTGWTPFCAGCPSISCFGQLTTGDLERWLLEALRLFDSRMPSVAAKLVYLGSRLRVECRSLDANGAACPRVDWGIFE